MSVYKQKTRRTYMMDFVFKGHRIIETTGKRDKRQAQRVEEKRREELETGTSGLRKKEHLYFLGEAAEAWRNKPRKKPWSPSMCGIADSTMRKILEWFGKDRLLADIEAKHILAYQQARLAETPRLSNRSINMQVGTLRKILIHTGHWTRLREDVHMLEERKDVGKALTPEQERLLLESCAASVSRALAPFVTLAIDTGARYDTIRSLQWGRVDLQRGLITIGKDKTAAGTGRVVPLNGRALRTLLNWADQFPDRKPEHYVFPIELYGLIGKKGTFGGKVKVHSVDSTRPVGTIQSAWETAKRRTQRHCPQCSAGTLKDAKPTGYRCDKCKAKFAELPEGLSTFRFHDLRHTSVSRMITAGQPLPIIAKVVGWRLSTVVEMAERYGHFEEDALRRAVQSIGAPPPPDPRVNPRVVGIASARRSR